MPSSGVAANRQVDSRRLSSLAAPSSRRQEASAPGLSRLAREIVGRAAQALATFAAAVRAQLFQKGEPVRVSYIGGVFRSPRILERYRMLMEFDLGNEVVAPAYGPAAGALLESYRIAGISCKPQNVPEEK